MEFPKEEGSVEGGERESDSDSDAEIDDGDGAVFN